MEYKQAYSIEGAGVYGPFGIKVMVSLDRKLTEKDLEACGEAARSALDAMQAETIATDPKKDERATAEREELIGLFGDTPIYVEEIPNGYSSNDSYYKHFPWFVVTTGVGRIKIGWRKRVIEIDWSNSDIKKTAEQLLPHKKVTKWEQSIHAWNIEDAQRYIDVLLS